MEPRQRIRRGACAIAVALLVCVAAGPALEVVGCAGTSEEMSATRSRVSVLSGLTSHVPSRVRPTFSPRVPPALHQAATALPELSAHGRMPAPRTTAVLNRERLAVLAVLRI